MKLLTEVTLKERYRDWRRGYTDADVASLAAKCSPEWPQCLEPDSRIALTQGEFNAVIADLIESQTTRSHHNETR